jgi:hypothetical protein
MQRKTRFVGTKAVSYALKFITHLSRTEKTFQCLKPFINEELFETVLQIMFVSHKDANLFEENPIEFERRNLDFSQTIYNPKQVAIEFIGTVCGKYKSAGKTEKDKPDYIVGYLEYTERNLKKYNAMISQK